MPLTYRVGNDLNADELAALYRRASLNRPIDDLTRMGKMIENANFIISAWDGQRLVGVSRSVTDFAYCCYLSDLAVDPEYQKSGIGQELVRRTQEALGDEVMILLLSVPAAMEYYPKIGFEKNDRAFMIPRKR